MTPPFRITPLAAEHDRKILSCGAPALDRYLREQASQDVRRLVAACYVAVGGTSGAIAGYYTLSAAHLALPDVPAPLGKRLPGYPNVPVARLGRLAVSQAHQGRRLGGALLWDAIRRAARSEVAVFAIVVDAKDDAAEAFYRHHGFLDFGGAGRQLILALASFKS